MPITRATTMMITMMTATDVGDADADGDADDLPLQVCFHAL